jgi:exonuclease III
VPRFLFWNVGGQGDVAVLRNLARANDIDLLVLAECGLNPAAIVLALNQDLPHYRFAETLLCDKLHFFTRFDASFFRPILHESARVSIRGLRLPGRQKIIVAAAHMPSKLHFSERDQTFEFVNLADEIIEAEKKEGHSRTIFLGDLNANPFEDGVVSARGLNAVMNRNVAMRGSRTVQGHSYPFFYNPMWAHFGDRVDEPGGTFYYEKAQHLTYFWNIFDQVLIRPELAAGFRHEHLRILTNVGQTPLVESNGRPDKALLSDHLPVILEVEF